MIKWELHKPEAASVNRLDEISGLRGRVLYDNGRRPAFRLPTGRFADPDPLDRHAYHVIARNDGNTVVGCVRNIPVTNGITCLTERLLGERQFAKMLNTFGVKRKNAVESSRWMVDLDFRATRIGILLAAGSVSVAKAFGFKLLFCSVGTRDRQDCLLSRLGLSRVPELPLIPVPEFDDELCVMYIKPNRPPHRFALLMAEISAELKLDRTENPGDQATSKTKRSINAQIGSYQ